MLARVVAADAAAVDTAISEAWNLKISNMDDITVSMLKQDAEQVHREGELRDAGDADGEAELLYIRRHRTRGAPLEQQIRVPSTNQSLSALLDPQSHDERRCSRGKK